MPLGTLFIFSSSLSPPLSRPSPSSPPSLFHCFPFLRHRREIDSVFVPAWLSRLALACLNVFYSFASFPFTPSTLPLPRPLPLSLVFPFAFEALLPAFCSPQQVDWICCQSQKAVHQSDQRGIERTGCFVACSVNALLLGFNCCESLLPHALSHILEPASCTYTERTGCIGPLEDVRTAGTACTPCPRGQT